MDSHGPGILVFSSEETIKAEEQRPDPVPCAAMSLAPSTGSLEGTGGKAI